MEGIIPQIEEFNTMTYNKLTLERFDEAIKAMGRYMGRYMGEQEINLPYPKGIVFLNKKAEKQWEQALIDAIRELYRT